MLSLAVLAGYGLSYIFKRFDGKFFNKISKKHVLAVVFSCLILFEFLAIPYPMSSTKVPEFYHHIANDSEDYAIFEVPRPIGFAPYMYYQTIHEKKLVNGYVSRTPNNVITFIYSTPIISQLSQLSKNIPILKEDILNHNVTQIGLSVLNYYNIRYIVLHKKHMTEEQLDFASNLLQKTLKEKYGATAQLAGHPTTQPFPFIPRKIGIPVYLSMY
jgi:predicted PurR-regulated permease PerM